VVPYNLVACRILGSVTRMSFDCSQEMAGKWMGCCSGKYRQLTVESQTVGTLIILDVAATRILLLAESFSHLCDHMAFVAGTSSDGAISTFATRSIINS